VRLTHDHPSAWLAPAALFGNAVFVENASQAEIYSAQTCFFVLAVFWFLRDSRLTSGALALAFLVTPSTLLQAPGLFFLRRPSWRTLSHFLLAGIFGLLAISLTLHDYLWGDRGLLQAQGQSLPLTRIVMKEGFELFAFLAFLPLLALGLAHALRRPELRPLVLALAGGWLGGFIFGERFADVPVQLPIWTLASLLAPLGALELLERRKRMPWLVAAVGAFGSLTFLVLWPLRARASSFRVLDDQLLIAVLTVLALAIGAAFVGRARGAAALGLLSVVFVCGLTVTLKIVAAKRLKIDEFREQVLTIGRVAPADRLIVATWDRGILFEHYLSRRSYTDQVLFQAFLSGGWGEERRASAQERWKTSLEKGREVWLLGVLPERRQELATAGYTIDEMGPEILRARLGGGLR
jgi:hypothetical protein